MIELMLEKTSLYNMYEFDSNLCSFQDSVYMLFFKMSI